MGVQGRMVQQHIKRCKRLHHKTSRVRASKENDCENSAEPPVAELRRQVSGQSIQDQNGQSQELLLLVEGMVQER